MILAPAEVGKSTKSVMENNKTYVIASAIIKHGNKFLIGRRLDSKTFAPGKWEFISGFIEEKVTAEEVIAKELKEELGIEGRIIRSGEPFSFAEEGLRWIVIPFLIESELKNNFYSNDHSQLLLVNKGELKGYNDLRPYIENQTVIELIKGVYE